MPRLLSVRETVPQVEDRTKTVSRRLGWLFARHGQGLWLVDSSPRNNPEWRRLALVELVDVTREPLDAITAEDVAREGFPGHTPQGFARWYSLKFGCELDDPVTRLEWRYLE